MLRKLNIAFFLALAAALSVSSCKKWVDVEAPLQVNENKLFSDEQGFKDVLNGVYLNMGTRALYGRDLSIAASQWEPVAVDD